AIRQLFPNLQNGAVRRGGLRNRRDERNRRRRSGYWRRGTRGLARAWAVLPATRLSRLFVPVRSHVRSFSYRSGDADAPCQTEPPGVRKLTSKPALSVVW